MQSAYLGENATPAGQSHKNHKICNNFISPLILDRALSLHNDRCFCDELRGIALIEVFVRLGLALLLSLGLAVLLAWGWDSSDRTHPSAVQQLTEAPAPTHPAQ